MKDIKSLFKNLVPKQIKEIRRRYLASYYYKKNSQLGLESSNKWIRKSASIDGWLNEGEHEFLWKLASNNSVKGDIIEIGSWMGKSTCILAGACKEKMPLTKVVSIDTFLMSGDLQQSGYHKIINKKIGTFDKFIENAIKNEYYEYVIPLATKSEIAKQLLSRQFRMAFIDGAHDFENCLADFNLVSPLILPGGILALHDYGSNVWPGVQRVVDETIRLNNRFELIDNVGSIVAFKCSDEK